LKRDSLLSVLAKIQSNLNKVSKTIFFHKKKKKENVTKDGLRNRLIEAKLTTDNQLIVIADN